MNSTPPNDNERVKRASARLKELLDASKKFYEENPDFEEPSQLCGSLPGDPRPGEKKNHHKNKPRTK